MGSLEQLIPGLIALVMPAAEHALGADAPLDDKHKWCGDMVKSLVNSALSRVGVPSWVKSLQDPIDQIISAELEHLAEKVGA